ncbi:MAG: c-type cytochrome domain-containing protein [Cyclobacteriaceae bacterium]
MKLFHRIAANSVLAINAFLLFLVFFRERVVFPAWMHVLGRMHPLLLHLPIGILILAGLLLLFRRAFKPKSFGRILLFTWSAGALTAALTSLFGFILSTEPGYKAEQINGHLLSGVAVSLLAWVALMIPVTNMRIQQLTFAITLSVLLVAGHLGSVITHGADFLWAPLMTPTAVTITDSTSLYEAAIHPILRQKCEGCHNPQKAKGELIMTSLEQLLAGGKHGPIWKAGMPDSSHLMVRVLLPEEHDEHMPPQGKTPLTKAEVELMRRWISSGADVYKPWSRYPKDTLFQLVAARLTKPAEAIAPAWNFEPASQATIDELNTPFRTVAPIAANAPALKASFYVAEAFHAEDLTALEQIKTQLVELNLAGMPVTDDQMAVITSFQNLEKLILNNSKVSGAGLATLRQLPHLKSLAINGLPVSESDALKFNSFPALNEVFAWNTPLAVGLPAAVATASGKIRWELGYHSNEMLQLTPPLVANTNYLLGDSDAIRLRHNLPGTRIRFTLDGTLPDSTSTPFYEKPVSITAYTLLKARAVRDGWYSSRIIEVPFFKKGYVPDAATLISKPDKSYQGEGAATLVNGKKGSADNYRDVAWLAFREQPFIAAFEFKEVKPVKSLTISYARNMGSWLVPPELIEVWGGNNDADLRLIASARPAVPSKFESNRVEGVTLPITGGAYRRFKIKVTPTSHLPEFISKKREKAWFFVDEIIFN